MRLLILTQKVDKDDPILGFFVRWVEEFAKHFEIVTVICLEKGEYDLPENVKVLSLGKERHKKNLDNNHVINHVIHKLRYIIRFYFYIWRERKNYDSVFVHMNQEYVLLAGDMWRLMGKKVMLWRNHAKGNILTRMAVFMSHRVFCTSPSSYTAQFAKTEIMPVGIDTEFFNPDPSVERLSNSVLFLGRISPVKRVLEFIDWAKERGYRATIAGPILLRDKEYGERVKSQLTHSQIKYVGPVNQEEARRLYRTHEIYVNFTPAGSFDKTILEAAACGTKVKVENKDLKHLDAMSVEELREFVVENHSLKKLVHNVANTA